jgi:hypothetical protein
MNLLIKFIRENNLTFEKGERNTNITVLCGYALYLGSSKRDIKESILTVSAHTASDCYPEVERVFDYGEKNAYGDWWATEQARQIWKF